MTSYVTPKKATQFITYVSLVSQADTDIMQANPTLATGDCQVSKDGGALTNLAALPTVTPASGKMVKIILSTDEMNADNVTVVFCDAAGDEWQDLVLNIQTTAQQIDDLSTLVQADILDDATPFSGANIDAAISSRSTVTTAQVNTECDTALTDYDPPTHAELTSGLAGLNDVTAAEVWASTTRTLTQSGTSVAAAVDGGSITGMRGDYWSFTITGLGDISGRTKLWFSAKSDRSLADSAALIRVEETAGLEYWNGAAATAGDGSLTVNDETTGSVTILVAESCTDDATVAGGYRWDVQMLDASGTITLKEGAFAVTADVTRVIA